MKPQLGVPRDPPLISWPIPPRDLPNPWLSRTSRLLTSCKNGTSSSMTSCSPMSAMAQNNGATASSPSRNAFAPPPIPFRSAQRLPTCSPFCVVPPQRKSLIWLNQGATTLEYLCAEENCILAKADCSAVKARNDACSD